MSSFDERMIECLVESIELGGERSEENYWEAKMLLIGSMEKRSANKNSCCSRNLQVLLFFVDIKHLRQQQQPIYTLSSYFTTFTQFFS